jgi:hypothetical protein
MAIMKSGPGTRAKKTSTSRKVTSKDVVSKIRNVFSGGSKNLGKAKGPGGLAGVVSNKGGVRTTTAVKVTGSKKAGIESLKAKRKSGEMTRQEANAKIKNLRNISVTGKRKPVEYEQRAAVSPIRGMKMSELNKLKSMDSSTFMNLAKSSDPYSKSIVNKGNRYTPVGFEKGGKKGKGPGNLYNDLKIAMSKTAKKYPGAKFSDFKLDPITGSYTYKYNTPKKK